MNLRSATARLLALALTTPLVARAQFTPQNDPANLAGERVSASDLADDVPINHGALALQQLLRKLRTRASFMLIVAHPDDEDNGMLTYLSRGKGARVATLTLNRGEGGQNLMSADFGDALGLIRTQELLLSDRYMGVDQFFGTEVDFGFSKTKEEAFSKWTHERVLYDAVRAIRLYRPLVIASVFIGEPSDGHGQHQVAGEIAQEAFKAAGNPNVFPDQIAAGLLPWQPLKVYARAPFGRIDEKGMYDYATNQYVPARFENYVTGKVTTTVPKANVVVPEGDTDPLLGGKSYAQFGREGRSLQRSQIGGGGGSRGQSGGRVDVSYHRYGSMLHQPDDEDSGLESSFFDGIDTSLPGMASLAPEISDKLRPGLQRLDDALVKAQHDFDPAKPEAIAPTLRDGLSAVDAVIRELQNPAVNDLPRTQTFNLLHELLIKRVQLNDALVLALGLQTSTVMADLPEHAPLTPGATFSIQTTVRMTGTAEVKVQSVNLNVDAGLTSLSLPVLNHPSTLSQSHAVEFAREFQLPLPITPTRPYFHRKNSEEAVYELDTPTLRNAPKTPLPLTVEEVVLYDETALTLSGIVQSSTPSSVPQPTVVVPRLSVDLNPRLQIAPLGNETRKPIPFIASVKTNVPNMAPRVEVGCPPAWKLTVPRDADEDFTLAHPGDFHVTSSTVLPIGLQPADGPEDTTLTAYAVDLTPGFNRAEYSEGYRSIGYPGLPTTNYYTPATLRIIPVDVHTAPNLNIAYLPGTGDDVPSGLDQLGIHAHLITVADIASGKLSQYDVIILGVRAYAAHPELAGKGSAALIDYARNGGVVIAQYNNARYGKDEAPFPISVAASSGDHAHDVVDESAPVTILSPDSPILTWPNRITTADFSGWVEERGHSFAASWAPEYQPLLSTHDPGQDPQQGGLLVAHVDKGLYIYLGLALYRQLPEGVPGSYRLLANLISAAKNPQIAAKR